MNVLLLFFGLFVSLSEGSPVQEKSKPVAYPNFYEYDLCATVYCKKGEECVLNGGIAQCQCATVCPVGRSVCASDGRTYKSHCHMHRQACITKQRLHMVYSSPCENEEYDEEYEDEDEFEVDEIELESDSKSKPLSYTFPKVYTWDESVKIDQAAVKQQNKQINQPSIDSQHKHEDKLVDNENHERNDNNINHFQPKQEQNLTAEIKNDSTYKCEDGDIVFLKNNLLLYFHAKFGEFSEGYDHRDKYHLMDVILEQLDVDKDGQVTESELDAVQNEEESYSKLLPPGCSLGHLVDDMDIDYDRLISRTELFNGFGVFVPFVDKGKDIIVHEVQPGNQYQILCTIEPHQAEGLKRNWFRQERPLPDIPDNHFQVKNDVLYLTPARPEHSGNFSCKIDSVEQIHIVKIKDKVTVIVEPNFLLLKTGENGRIECVVKGSFTHVPKIQWKKNKITITGNSSILEFQSAEPTGTGTYKCIVNLPTGEQIESSTSVVIRDQFQQPEITMRQDSEPSPNLVIFGTGGMEMYSTVDCLPRKVIPSTYVGLDLNRPSLCEKTKCTWSDGMTVGSDVIYAILKREKALAIVNINNASVLQLIPLENNQGKLDYNQMTDILWIMGESSVAIIRDASILSRKSLVHTNLLGPVFLPPTDSTLMHGYAQLDKSMKLHKIKLENAEPVAQVDLSSHSCIPTNVAFIQHAGIIVVYCSDEYGRVGDQLVLDYMSDIVLHVHNDGVAGTPLLLDSAPMLLTLNQWTGKATMQSVHNRDVYIWSQSEANVPLSDWLVRPSANGIFGYSLVAISPYTNDVITIDMTRKNIGEVGNIDQSSDLSSVTRGKLMAECGKHYAYVRGTTVNVHRQSSDLPVCNIQSNDVQIIKFIQKP